MLLYHTSDALSIGILAKHTSLLLYYLYIPSEVIALAISEAKKRADARYRKANRAQIVIDVSKEQREQINDYCKARGGTATYIKRLLRDDMRANGVEPLDTNGQT